MPKLILLLTFFAFVLSSALSQAPYIDPLLSSYDGKKECLICGEKAQIEDNLDDLSKEEKAQRVYTLLKEKQKELTSVQKYLKSLEIPFQNFWVANCVAATLSSDQIKAVSALPFVHRIYYNHPIEKSEIEPANSTTLRNPQYTWGLQMIGADVVQEMGYKGQGVTVGGQDTGVKWDLSSLSAKYRGRADSTVQHDYNWHDAIHEISPLHGDSTLSPDNNPCGLDVPAPCDDDNHGSHTVGTMVGSEGEDIIGVAPEAQWMACRCMERGWGSVQTYLECFQFFLAPTDLLDENPHPELAPHVINNSWGCPSVEGCNPTNFSVLQDAVDNLKQSGVVVVVSAGNDGRQGCSSVKNPAAIYENSFTVGATASNDSIANFSSRGPVVIDSSGRIKPDVSAPGVGVRSQIINGSYVSWNGTSMAGPHVAGLVALMISANPKLAGRVDIIEDIIKNTAVKKWRDDLDCDTSMMQVPNNIHGWGRIDALAAVEEALKYVPTGTITPNDPDVILHHSPEGILVIVPETLSQASCTIYDTWGRPVATFSSNAFSRNILFVNTTTWSSGGYHLVLYDSHGQHFAKSFVVP